MTRSFILCCSAVLFFEAVAANAQSVVDRSSELKTIRTEFGMADGAAWDGLGTLYVPDVKDQVLMAYSPNQDKWWKRLPTAGRISATFYQLGRLYLSDNAGQRILSMPHKGEPSVVAEFSEGERPNDLVVDNTGGIYVTLTKQGEVRYVAADGKISTVAENVQAPNGIILSPDGNTLYVSEFIARKVIAMPVIELGKLGKRIEFASLDGIVDKGADGMTVDRAGNVYCGGPDGVWIWNPEGKLLDRIATPSKAINCAFGGDGRSLFISTQKNGVLEQRMFAYGCEPQPSVEEIAPVHKSRPTTAVPGDISAHLDVVYGLTGSRKLLADIFVPDGEEVKPAIVVVHGGGWLKGDKTKFRALAVKLSKLGYVTAAIEYRLGYEANFPAGIQDCYGAVRFLKANAAKYRVDPSRIAAVGGSAGGHLVGLMGAAAGVAELQGDSGNQDQSSNVKAVVVMAGPLQMVTGSVAERSRKKDTKANSNYWLGKTIDEDPTLYRLADAYEQLSKGTPPMMFLVGSLDNPDRNAPARDKLKKLGVPVGFKVYPDVKHGAWNRLPWIDDYVRDIDAFLKEHL